MEPKLHKENFAKFQCKVFHKNYFFEFTPTASTGLGTLLYNANLLPTNHILNKANLHKANQLESTFIELINPKKQYHCTIVCSLYKLPNLDV